MKIGYLIGSHVVHNHVAVPLLLRSMRECDVFPEDTFVVVNGSTSEHEQTVDGVHYFFRKPDDWHHLAYPASEDMGERFGITHWFYLNCTSSCGPEFRKRVENGFDPDADATVATNYMLRCDGEGHLGRPINDLAMYRNDFLVSVKDRIVQMRSAGEKAIVTDEGLTFALAPKQAMYPDCGYSISDDAEDVYGSGTLRRTEYHKAIDWYRYKKNWGQMGGNDYKAATL